MQVCPKCGAFYAGDATFCHTDGTPLVPIALDSDLAQANQAIAQRDRSLSRRQRRVKIRRILLSTVTLLLVARVFYVVATQGIVHSDAKPTPTATPTPSRTLTPTPTPSQTPTPTPTPAYKISGQIRTAAGNLPFAVELRLTGNKKATTVTDASGKYVFAGLPAGDYSVTPVNDRMNFEPRSRTINKLHANETADFLGITPRVEDPTVYQISGQVRTAAGKLPFAVELRLTGKKKATTVTDANGKYVFAGLPAGDYSVTPVNDRMNFEPRSRTINKLHANETADFLGIPRRIENPHLNGKPGTDGQLVPKRRQPTIRPKPS